MTPEPKAATVYFDGSCPLCRAEIRHYKGLDGAETLCFIDVSQPDAPLGADLGPKQAMARFHVRDGDGRLLSGAAAFVAVWRRLPRWRWAARIAALPGMLALLEGGYRLFLPIRPALSKLVGAVLSSRGSPEKPGTSGTPGAPPPDR